MFRLINTQLLSGAFLPSCGAEQTDICRKSPQCLLKWLEWNRLRRKVALFHNKHLLQYCFMAKVGDHRFNLLLNTNNLHFLTKSDQIWQCGDKKSSRFKYKFEDTHFNKVTERNEDDLKKKSILFHVMCNILPADKSLKIKIVHNGVWSILDFWGRYWFITYRIVYLFFNININIIFVIKFS